MARSMIQRRQEAERIRIEAYDATLQRVSRAARPSPDFLNALREAQAGTHEPAIRTPQGWRPRMKTRDPARLRLAAARHLYARYAVPAHLERIWLDATGLDMAEAQLRRRWYAIVARGGSLYKEGAGEWLSRREVHAFLNAPGEMTFENAFWHAIVRGYTDDAGLALRIAGARLARTPRAELAFWRDAARFFCANPAQLETIDDLCDYLADQHGRDRAWNLKGRTLASLTRQMHEWHRDLAAIRRIEAMQQRAARAAGWQAPADGRWPGSTVADWSWQPSAKEAKERREAFAVRQLTTAAALVEETRAMRHCVSTYAAKCVSGNASIWSLTRRTHNRSERLLTMEVDRQNRVVQVRGFANRPANADERQVLSRWAKARGLMLA